MGKKKKKLRLASVLGLILGFILVWASCDTILKCACVIIKVLISVLLEY